MHERGYVRSERCRPNRERVAHAGSSQGDRLITRTGSGAGRARDGEEEGVRCQDGKRKHAYTNKGEMHELEILAGICRVRVCVVLNE